MLLGLGMHPRLHDLCGHQGAQELAHRAVLEPGRDTLHGGRGRVALPPGAADGTDPPRVLALPDGVPESGAPATGEGAATAGRTLSALVEGEAEVPLVRRL